jgi:hypothetical protein
MYDPSFLCVVTMTKEPPNLDPNLCNKYFACVHSCFHNKFKYKAITLSFPFFWEHILHLTCYQPNYEFYLEWPIDTKCMKIFHEHFFVTFIKFGYH